MKRFTVPEDIQLVDLPKGTVPPAVLEKPITFAEYASLVWLNDERLGHSPTAMAKLNRYIDRFLNAKAGDAIELEDADYELVASIARDPKAGYKPMVARQLLPFPAALLEAE